MFIEFKNLYAKDSKEETSNRTVQNVLLSFVAVYKIIALSYSEVALVKTLFNIVRKFIPEFNSYAQPFLITQLQNKASMKHVTKPCYKLISGY